MGLGCGDIGVRRIDTDHLGAEPRQRLAKDAAAAADVEDAEAFERIELLGVVVEVLGGAVADIADPHRIELVQRGHLAARVPPFAGHRGKPRDFGVIDRGCGGAHVEPLGRF
jgi:hypothetical protein